MDLDFTQIKIGYRYSRKDLIDLWPKYSSTRPLERGVVTPADSTQIILFITEIKNEYQPDYNDFYDKENDLLWWDGENKHGNDKRIIQSTQKGDDIHVFYRIQHRELFKYLGRVKLLSAIRRFEPNSPSSFVFEFIHDPIIITLPEKQAKNEAKLPKGYAIASEIDQEKLITAKELEGSKRFHLLSLPERNPKNRKHAIEIHGRICMICSFDFDKFYGAENSNGYIEIHHINPLSQGERLVDPTKDLIPVCSNCHRIIHRKRDFPKSIPEMKKIVERFGQK